MAISPGVLSFLLLVCELHTPLRATGQDPYWEGMACCGAGPRGIRPAGRGFAAVAQCVSLPLTVLPAAGEPGACREEGFQLSSTSHTEVILQTAG